MRFLRRGKEHAPTIDLLVAGLGNPGRDYERTRHNAGCMVVDELARRADASFRSKFNGRLALTAARSTNLSIRRAIQRSWASGWRASEIS